MKSGIDMLQDILEKLDLLNKRLEITEQNTKLLLNTRASNSPQPSISSAAAISPSPQISQSKEESKPFSKSKGKIKVIGDVRVQNKLRAGVKITIFDTNNNIVKVTKTNNAGRWMSWLPPGKYGAEYFLNEVIGNVVFSVDNSSSVIRVAQPEGT